jgi:hypothetical protein
MMFRPGIEKGLRRRAFDRTIFKKVVVVPALSATMLA